MRGRTAVLAALVATCVACGGGARKSAAHPTPQLRAAAALKSPLDGYDGPIVEVDQIVLDKLPELFSEDGRFFGVRDGAGCRLWEVRTGGYFGRLERGCGGLIAPPDFVEPAPGPCRGCGEAVASARDRLGKHLAIARKEPASVEVWDVASKRLEARTVLEGTPVEHRLVWNADVVHGEYVVLNDNAEYTGVGGLFAWSPGHAPVMAPASDASTPNFGGAVFEPHGAYAVVMTAPLQRLAAGALNCVSLGAVLAPCGPLWTEARAEPANEGNDFVLSNSGWKLSADGPLWVTETSVSSLGRLASNTFFVLFPGGLRPATASGGIPFDHVPADGDPDPEPTRVTNAATNDAATNEVERELVPRHGGLACARVSAPDAEGALASKLRCETSEPSDACRLVDLSAGGRIAARECDDALRLETRAGGPTLSVPAASFVRWLGPDVALAQQRDGVLVLADVARQAFRPLEKALGTAMDARGGLLAIATATGVRVLALPSLDERAIFKIAATGPLALSNDGRLLAVALADAVEVHAVTPGQTGAGRLPSIVLGNATRLVFRSDGAVLFAFERGGTARAFDVRSGVASPGTEHRMTTPSLDPLGRVEGLDARTFRRLTDNAILTIAEDGASSTDRGVWDGVPPSRMYRFGDDPLVARLVSAEELGTRMRHVGLIEDFFNGKPLGDPALLARIVHQAEKP